MRDNSIWVCEFGVIENGTKCTFKIFHTLPEVRGLAIGDAFENWLARTKQATAESFVAYVRSKHTGHIIATEAEMEAVQKEIGDRPLNAKQMRKWLDK